MKISKKINVIITSLLLYLLTASAGTLVVAVGTSLVKSRKLGSSVAKADTLLKNNHPEQALNIVQNSLHLAKAFSPYFRILQSIAVRAHARLGEYKKAGKTADKIYNWNMNLNQPSADFLSPIVELSNKIVTQYLSHSGIGIDYNRWSGYSILIMEMRMAGEFERLEELAEQMLDIDPTNELAQRAKLYAIKEMRPTNQRADTAKLNDQSRQRSTYKRQRRTPSRSVEKSSTASKTQEVSDADNPYKDEYQAAKKEYSEFYKTVKQLTAKRDSATGEDRIRYADQLHKMKYEGITLQRNYETAAKKYKAWKRRNSQ